MCVIIDAHSPSLIEHDHLRRGLVDNPDGWGIMVSDGSRILTERGMSDEEFWQSYEKVKSLGTRVTVHFRWATHGSKSTRNCHPFLICDDKYSVMHNGVISDVPSNEKDRSDTYHFAKYIVQPILAKHPDLFGTEYLETMLKTIVGSGNKIVIMRHDGERMFINRGAGVEVTDGLWMSNSGPLYDGTYGGYCGWGGGRGNVARLVRGRWQWGDDESDGDGDDEIGSWIKGRDGSWMRTAEDEEVEDGDSEVTLDDKLDAISSTTDPEDWDRAYAKAEAWLKSVGCAEADNDWHDNLMSTAVDFLYEDYLDGKSFESSQRRSGVHWSEDDEYVDDAEDGDDRLSSIIRAYAK
jgi:hypothetical protein